MTTFTGTGEILLSFIVLYATSIGVIFASLDSIQFLDAPFSLLDVFIAALLLDLIFWFILKLLLKKEQEWMQGSRDDAYVSNKFEEYLSSKDVSSTDADEDLND